jgi:chorismate mutase
MRSLENLRRDIDAIDDEIIALLARRLALVPEVVEYKLANSLPTVIPDRIDEVLNRNADHAARMGMPPDEVRAIYERIIQAMCAAEDRLRAVTTSS